MFEWKIWGCGDNYDLEVVFENHNRTVLVNTSDNKVYRWRMTITTVARLVGLVYTKDAQLEIGDDYEHA